MVVLVCLGLDRAQYMTNTTLLSMPSSIPNFSHTFVQPCYAVRVEVEGMMVQGVDSIADFPRWQTAASAQTKWAALMMHEGMASLVVTWFEGSYLAF